MSLHDSMNVSEEQMDQFFNDITDLVTCLKNLQHINDLQRDTMVEELNKVIMHLPINCNKRPFLFCHYFVTSVFLCFQFYISYAT